MNWLVSSGWSHPVGVTILFSLSWSHLVGLIWLVSPGFSHPDFLTQLISPFCSHQIVLTLLVSSGWSHLVVLTQMVLSGWSNLVVLTRLVSPGCSLHVVISQLFSPSCSLPVVLTWLFSLGWSHAVCFLSHHFIRQSDCSSLNNGAHSLPSLHNADVSPICAAAPTAATLPFNARRHSGQNGVMVKFISAKGLFADHCVEFEAAHRVLLAVCHPMCFDVCMSAVHPHQDTCHCTHSDHAPHLYTVSQFCHVRSAYR